MERSGKEEDLTMRRRRARFRAWHRGTREMDLVMGRFADATIEGWSSAQLADYEALLDLPEADVFAWVTGEVPVPEEYDTDLFRRLVTFHGGQSATEVRA